MLPAKGPEVEAGTRSGSRDQRVGQLDAVRTGMAGQIRARLAADLHLVVPDGGFRLDGTFVRWPSLAGRGMTRPS